MKSNLYIEYNAKQTDEKFLLDTAKEIWKSEGYKVKDLESVELYFKPAESICYYIFNGELKGSFHA